LNEFSGKSKIILSHSQNNTPLQGNFIQLHW